MPETPDTLQPGEALFSVQVDVINNMLRPTPSDEGVVVVEDNEYQRMRFAWRRGIAPGTEMSVAMPLLWRNGGFLDPLINALHRLLGLGGNAEDNPLGREGWPDFQSLLLYADAQGQARIRAGSAFGPGDIALFLKRRLARETPRSALAGRIGLKLPVGNPGLLLGSGSPDLGAALDGRYGAGRDVTLYGSVGRVWMGRAGRAPGAARAMTQWFAGIEYHPNRRDSYLWQVDGSTAAVRTGHPFADRIAATATFGYRRLLHRRLLLTASVSENGDYNNYSLPFLGSVGPDFTTMLALEWR